MMNKSNKNNLGDSPIIIWIGIISSIITIVVFVTGINNISEIFGTSKKSVESTANTPVQLSTIMPTATPRFEYILPTTTKNALNDTSSKYLAVRDNPTKYFSVDFLGSRAGIYDTFQITNLSGLALWTYSYRDVDNGCSVKNTFYSWEETFTVSQLADRQSMALDCKNDVQSITFYLDWQRTMSINISLPQG